MQRYTVVLAFVLFAGIGVCLGAVIPDSSFQDVLKLTNEQPDEVLSRQQRAAQGFGDYGGHGHYHGHHGGPGGYHHGGGFGGEYYPGGGYGGHHHHHSPYYGGGYYGGYPGYGYGGGYGPGFGIYFG